MNTRRKGQRSLAKAIAYAKSLWPKATLLTMYQPTRFAKPQPFDLLVLEYDQAPMLIEVRTNQWGVAKPQTRQLAGLPGLVTKEIWLFRRGHQHPSIRRWMGQSPSWQLIVASLPFSHDSPTLYDISEVPH